jgi:hypothetical protein
MRNSAAYEGYVLGAAEAVERQMLDQANVSAERKERAARAIARRQKLRDFVARFGNAPDFAERYRQELIAGLVDECHGPATDD